MYYYVCNYFTNKAQWPAFNIGHKGTPFTLHQFMAQIVTDNI